MIDTIARLSSASLQQTSNDNDAPPSSPTIEAVEIPAELSTGPFLWDVRVDGHLQRWLLGIAYGQCSLPRQQVVSYRGQHYTIEQVHTSLLVVSSLPTLASYTSDSSDLLSSVATTRGTKQAK